MTNNTIRTNTGTYGVSDTAAIGPLMQGQAGVVMTFTLTDLAGTAVNLTGLTITGTITNNQTKATAALQGAIALVTPASGIFSWTTDADDVGTAGSFKVIFTVGTSLITLPAHLAIIETPAATITFGAALVGVTVAEAAWLTAALAALPNAGDLANVPDPAGVTDGYVWTADGADGADWEAPAEPTNIGDWVVASNAFTLDLTGSDPTSQIMWQVEPYSTGYTWRHSFFRNADNVTMNWGFNFTPGGAALEAGKPGGYLQLESNYLVGGEYWTEWHIDHIQSDGSVIRPWGITINQASNYTTINWRGDSLQWLDYASGFQMMIAQPGATAATSEVSWYANQIVRPGTFFLVQGGNFLVHNADQSQQVSSYVFGGNYAFNAAAGTIGVQWYAFDSFVINGTGTGWAYAISSKQINATARHVITVPASQPWGSAVEAVGAAGQSENIIVVKANGGAVLWGLGPAGQIKTNQDAVNTNTPSGATAHQLPIYNEAGTLLGYIPVYGSAW